MAGKISTPAAPPAPAQGATGRTRKGSAAAAVKLDPVRPIPFETPGVMLSSPAGTQYVPFFSPGDNFFSMLLEARLLSNTQNACVNTIVKYCAGRGLAITNLEQGKEEPDEFKTWRKRCNGRNQSINKVLKKAFENYVAAGNVPVEIVRGRAGGKPFVYVYIKNVMDCRLEAPNAKTDECEAMLVSKAFRRAGVVTLKGNDYKRIPFYKSGVKGKRSKARYWLQDGDVERTALWLKNEVAGYDYYGVPASIGSLMSQLLEYGGGRFNMDNLENNMVVGGALVLGSNMTQAEAQTHGREIAKTYTGAGKRGRTVVIASEKGIKDSAYHSFDTHKEGSYLEADANYVQKIIISHEWDAVLAGLQSQEARGKGGSYLEQIYRIKYPTVIRPIVEEIMVGLVEPLVEIIDEWLGTNWSNELQLDVLQADLGSQESEASTTVKGLDSFLKIVEMVAAGRYPLQAAVKLVMHRYKLTQQQAEEQLGNIQVRTDVLNQPNPAEGPNNPG